MSQASGYLSTGRKQPKSAGKTGEKCCDEAPDPKKLLLSPINRFAFARMVRTTASSRFLRKVPKNGRAGLVAASVRDRMVRCEVLNCLRFSGSLLSNRSRMFACHGRSAETASSADVPSGHRVASISRKRSSSGSCQRGQVLHCNILHAWCQPLISQASGNLSTGRKQPKSAGETGENVAMKHLTSKKPDPKKRAIRRRRCPVPTPGATTRLRLCPAPAAVPPAPGSASQPRRHPFPPPTPAPTAAPPSRDPPRNHKAIPFSGARQPERTTSVSVADSPQKNCRISGMGLRRNFTGRELNRRFDGK